MLQKFMRVVVYVPIEESDNMLASNIVSARSVQAVLGVFAKSGFVGSIGTYRHVVEISTGLETYIPTVASTPTYGARDIPSIVSATRLVTYMPAITGDEELNRFIDEIAAVHPWEHPVIEVDQVSLWLPH